MILSLTKRVNSALGTFFCFIYSAEPKSVVLVSLSPPCCTAMPCQPGVTGFVVLMLWTPTTRATHPQPCSCCVLPSVSNSCWVHLSHTLVSHPSECHLCDAVCAGLDLLIFPLIPVGTVLVKLWCCHGCHVHVERVVFFGVFPGAGQRGNINSCWLLNNKNLFTKVFWQIPAFLFKMSFSEFFLKA